MLSVMVVLVIGIIIALFEVPPLLKKKMWRETISFLTLNIIGLTFCILLVKNFIVPSPLEWFIKIFDPMTELVDQLLS
jgi:membrane protein YdbS with pleckstrin-like domain